MSACSATKPPPPTPAKAPTTTTMMTHAWESARGGGPLDMVTAVDVITAERCQRESACNRIGRGRQFLSEDDCRANVVHAVRKAFNANTCNTGYVDPDSLDECLKAMREAGCNLEPTVYCDTPRICSP
jgi:hypothetical protein